MPTSPAASQHPRAPPAPDPPPLRGAPFLNGLPNLLTLDKVSTRERFARLLSSGLSAQHPLNPLPAPCAAASMPQVSQAFSREGGLHVYGQYRAHGYALNPPVVSAGGTLVPLDASTADAFRIGGLDWEPTGKPVTFGEAEDRRLAANYQAITRSDNGNLLSIQSKSYTPLDNSALQELCSNLDARVESILQLHGGKRIFIQMSINAQNDIVPGDVVRRYINLYNSHDGTSAFGMFRNDIRLWCANQLSYMLNRNFKNTSGDDTEGTIRHRHTSGINDFARRLPDMIRAERAAFNQQVDGFRALTQITATPELARRVLEATFADRLAVPIADRTPGAKRPRTLDDLPNEINAIRSHAYGSTGIGFDLEGVRGTMYGLYNAITQYLTHDAGRAKDPIERARKRLEGLYGGVGAARIERTREASFALI